MPGILRAVRLIPAAIAILTGITVATTIGILKSRFWPISFKWHYALVTLGAALFVVLLASWQVLKIG